MKMKYIIIGKHNGEKAVFWNKDRHWVVNGYDATIYDDIDKANDAVEYAELLWESANINEITIKEIFN